MGDSAEVAAGVDFKAGIGVEASGEAEISLEEVSLDVEIGAAIGIGMSISFDVSISPIGIVDDIGDGIQSVKDSYEAAKDFFGW